MLFEQSKQVTNKFQFREEHYYYMKKKSLYLSGLVIILLICIIIYFKPLSLSNLVSEDSLINMIFSEYVINNGEPDIEVVEYEDITAEQKNALLPILEKYTYRRTLGTLFSNGSMSGTGNKTLSIYVFDNDSNSIFISSVGKIVVNNKNYRMENTEQFIEQIMAIME